MKMETINIPVVFADCEMTFELNVCARIGDVERLSSYGVGEAFALLDGKRTYLHDGISAKDAVDLYQKIHIDAKMHDDADTDIVLRCMTPGLRPYLAKLLESKKYHDSKQDYIGTIATTTIHSKYVQLLIDAGFKPTTKNIEDALLGGRPSVLAILFKNGAKLPENGRCKDGSCFERCAIGTAHIAHDDCRLLSPMLRILRENGSKCACDDKGCEKVKVQQNLTK